MERASAAEDCEPASVTKVNRSLKSRDEWAFSHPELGQLQLQQGNPAHAHQDLVAWYHGAPGVGLALLRAGQLLEERDKLTAELDRALQTTGGTLNNSTSAAYGNFCLYSGACGCADFLLTAGQLLDRIEFREAADIVGSNGIAHCSQTDVPWPCGSVPGRESPNLMLGLAGIGYFYLRIHAPETVPSVLIASPRDGGAAGSEAGSSVLTPWSWSNGQEKVSVAEEAATEGQ